MGKGGGCVSSKKHEQTSSSSEDSGQPHAPLPTALPSSPPLPPPPLSPQPQSPQSSLSSLPSLRTQPSSPYSAGAPSSPIAENFQTPSASLLSPPPPPPQPQPLLPPPSPPLPQPISPQSPLPSPPRQPSTSTAPLKIFIVFYSMFDHVEKLAKRMKRGVDSVEGVEAILYRVPETLPGNVLNNMLAPPRDPRIPVITAAQLVEADGILFGFPTRFGCMAAQMKAFFDSTEDLWREMSLVGKPGGFFVSTGTQGGGQETSALTAITQLVHHGMLYVPIGYTYRTDMLDLDSVRGGSPYGAVVYAGSGWRVPSEQELRIAEYQGEYMAGVVKRLK